MERNFIVRSFVRPRCRGLSNEGGGGSKIFNRNLLKGSDMGGWIIHRNLINRFDTLLFRNPRAKRVLDGKDNARPIEYFASSGFKLMLHY